VTTYSEWRITGDPGEGYPPYTFTFSPQRGDDDPEGSARRFMDLTTDVHHKPWRDGPHLHHRTVTVSEWIAADDQAATDNAGYQSGGGTGE
jgi:hypothetical protein